MSEIRLERKRLAQKRWRENNLDKHRAIARAWYSRNRERQQAYNRTNYQRRREILRRFKLFKGCARCGFREHHAALNFHHVDPSQKEGEIWKFARSSMTAVRRELVKCVVLCANCHAITHAEGESRDASAGVGI